MILSYYYRGKTCIKGNFSHYYFTTSFSWIPDLVIILFLYDEAWLSWVHNLKSSSNLICKGLNWFTFLKKWVPYVGCQMHVFLLSKCCCDLKEFVPSEMTSQTFLSDMYEGTRMAKEVDIPRIKQLLRPLEESGTLIRRTKEEVYAYSFFSPFIWSYFQKFNSSLCIFQLSEALDSFIVVEREGQIIACAALFPFYEEKCGEVAAIAVSPECRGQGQGDKLLGMIN